MQGAYNIGSLRSGTDDNVDKVIGVSAIVLLKLIRF